MIRWKLVVPMILGAAALAGSLVYFVIPPPAPRLEVQEPSAPTAFDMTSSMTSTPLIVGQRRTAEEFERAAKEILKQLPNAQASAHTDEVPIIGHIPLPKRRPIPR
jgi:hypothetical protein